MADEHDKLSAHQQKAIDKSSAGQERRHFWPESVSSETARSNSNARGRFCEDEWSDENIPDGFEKYGRRPAKPTPTPAPTTAELPIATVIETRGLNCKVSIGDAVHTAKIAARFVMTGAASVVVVGDHVRVTTLNDHLLRIDAVEPRRSVLGRFASEGNRRTYFDPIAANINLVLMVCTPTSPPFRAGLIDRYFTAAALERLPMAICLNKADLGITDDVEQMLVGYESLGIQVLRLSAASGDGLDELKRTLESKITLFTGHSGVGKSTLLNAIQPGLALATGSVTEATAGTSKGRHTTSSARLIPLTLHDAYVVDSPGIREFGLGAIDPEDLITGFPEVAEASQRCEIRHCLHNGERDCAVERELSPTAFGQHRLASYRSLAN